MVLTVVGNKTDLESQHNVTREEAMQYATSVGGSYFESSALHDKGDVLFTILQHICNMTIKYQVVLVIVLCDAGIWGA